MKLTKKHIEEKRAYEDRFVGVSCCPREWESLKRKYGHQCGKYKTDDNYMVCYERNDGQFVVDIMLVGTPSYIENEDIQIPKIVRDDFIVRYCPFCGKGGE